MIGLREVVHFSFPFLVHFCIPGDNRTLASRAAWSSTSLWTLWLGQAKGYLFVIDIASTGQVVTQSPQPTHFSESNSNSAS